MLARTIKPKLNRLLDRSPAVVLIGPRQAGKTTLARELARERDAVYVDLERPSDLAKISDRAGHPSIRAAHSSRDAAAVLDHAGPQSGADAQRGGARTGA